MSRESFNTLHMACTECESNAASRNHIILQFESDEKEKYQRIDRTEQTSAECL